MAEKMTVARPYAEAAFRLAHETGNIQAWQYALDKLALIAVNPDIQMLLNNPKTGQETVARTFIEVTGDLDESMQGFVNLMLENKRVSVLPEVSQLFTALRHEAENSQKAIVKTAFALTPEQEDDLKNTLEKKYQCSLTLQIEIAPELIGGIRVILGDHVLDASVKGKLAALSASLKK